MAGLRLFVRLRTLCRLRPIIVRVAFNEAPGHLAEAYLRQVGLPVFCPTSICTLGLISRAWFKLSRLSRDDLLERPSIFCDFSLRTRKVFLQRTQDHNIFVEF